MPPRVRWTEKAKRLAKQYDLWDYDGGTIESVLCHSGKRGLVEAFGIESGGHHIWWRYKDGEIDAEYEMK